MNIDERWFSGLRGVDVPGFANPVHWPTCEKIRAHWNQVETDMRAYLETLTDEKTDSIYETMPIWQILLHVINHGTDHRAQTLAMLASSGVATFPQDFIIYLWQRP